MKLWPLFERLTGITKDDVKEYVKGRAVEFAKSITCVCGDPEWNHEHGRGKCLRCGNCPKFEPQFIAPAKEK